MYNNVEIVARNKSNASPELPVNFDRCRKTGNEIEIPAHL